MTKVQRLLCVAPHGGPALVVWQRQETGEWRMLVFAAQSSEEPWQQNAPRR